MGVRAFGACRTDELARMWGPVGWPPGRKLAAKDIRGNAEAYGLELLRVDGLDGQWAGLPEDVERLAEPRESNPPQKALLICPFDNVLWERDLVAELYGFDYRLEAYVPPAKRKYGYYVMPILWGERFVGRVDPKIDRKTGVLTINGMWLEERKAAPDGLVVGLADALVSLAEFVGAADIKIAKTRPASLRVALAKQV